MRSTCGENTLRFKVTCDFHGLFSELLELNYRNALFRDFDFGGLGFILLTFLKSLLLGD